MQRTLLAAGLAALLMTMACSRPIDENAELGVARREIAADLGTLNTASEVDPQINPESQAKGHAGQLSRIVKAFAIRAVKARRTWLDAQNNSQLADAISASALKQPGGFAAARAALKKLRDAIERYAQANQQNVATLRRDFETLPPEFSRGFDTGFSAAVTQEGGLNAILAFERRALDEVGRQLDDLEHTDWTDDGGQFVFANDHGLSLFNAHQTALIKIQKDEQAALDGARARQSTRLQNGARDLAPR